MSSTGGKTFSVVSGFAVSAVAGAFTGITGAQIAGMKMPQSASFDLSPLIYAFLGLGVSGTMFFILVAIMGSRRKMDFARCVIASGIGAIAIALISGVVGYPIVQHADRMNNLKARQQAAESDNRYQHYYAEIQSHPGIVLKEEWYKWNEATPERRHAYRMSIQERKVQYTHSILSELYTRDSEMKKQLLAHPSFDVELLEREYRRTFKRALRGDCETFVDIMRSPNAKSEWFEEVEASGLLDKNPTSCSDELKSVIRVRRQKLAEPGSN
jgi:hypothetical protein